MLLKELEARAGIEPAHKGFADLSLTTWVPRLGPGSSHSAFHRDSFCRGAAEWSGRRDLNSRPSPWQGDALPLSYSRLTQIRVYRAAETGSNRQPPVRNGFYPPNLGAFRARAVRPARPTVEVKFENGIIVRFEPVAEALTHRQERSSMGILLNPWSLIVTAVVAFLLFFSMGRTPNSN